jgi:hypothetical protein
MLVDASRVLGGDLGAQIGMAAVLAGAVIVLAWVGHPRAAQSPRLPFAALAIVVVVDATEGYVVERIVGGGDPAMGDKIYAFSAVLWAVVGIVSFAMLLLRRGRMRSGLVAALSFVALVGVCNALFGLASVAAVLTPLHMSADTAALSIDGVRAVAAIATLMVVTAVLATRRLRAATRLLAALLALNVAIQVLAWVDTLFDRTASVAERLTGGFSITAGVVLLVALLLEILSSGEAITNRHDRWLPRPSRVLLYLGYVVLVASAVLYFASLHAPQTGALLPPQFDSESWVHEGLLFLGVPLVATLFLGSIRVRRPQTRVGS